MSSETPPFDHSILFRLSDAEPLRGCCRRLPANAPVADLLSKPTKDWSRLLMELRPAIEACVNRDLGATQRVSRAWPMNHGMAGVRIQQPGRDYECVASLGGEGVERIQEIPTGRESEDAMVMFSPAPLGPPLGACYRHERVLDRDAVLIGWLSYDVC